MLLTGALACAVLAMGFITQAPAPVQAQEAKKDDKAPVAPKTFPVKQELLFVDLPVKGHLEAETMHELMLKPDSWSMFQVVKAIPHGARVNKGDQLVWLDMTKIDDAIKDSESAQVLADVAHRMAVVDLAYYEKLYPLEAAAAEEAKKNADDDLKHFMEKDKALAYEGAEQQFKQTQHQLEYTQEELKQLEKMYKAKDLTDDTEELILKRQRRAVDNMKFYLKMAEVSHERQLQADLPRRERSVIDATRRADLAYEKTKITHPMQLQQRKLQLEQAVRERRKAVERLDKLKKDREMMTITAPAPGIVYYGRCVKGQFPGAAGIEQMLQPSGNLPPNQVFMTIVDPSKLVIRANVEEKDRQSVKDGQTGKAAVNAFPDWKFPAKLGTLADVPGPNGGFDATLAIDRADGFDQLRPGMGVTTKLRVYKKDNALVVPESAVFKEDDDEDQRYVYVSLKKDGKYTSEKRPVTVGRKSGSKVEILQGLAAGDQILQAKPEN